MSVSLTSTKTEFWFRSRVLNVRYIDGSTPGSTKKGLTGKRDEVHLLLLLVVSYEEWDGRGTGPKVLRKVADKGEKPQTHKWSTNYP